MRLNQYFIRQEFACKCGCGFDVVDVTLLNFYTFVRVDSGLAMIILSGCRCDTHNHNIGGLSNSLHTKGKAGDITTRQGIQPIVDRLDKWPYQSVVYRDRGFVHIEIDQ